MILCVKQPAQFSNKRLVKSKDARACTFSHLPVLVAKSFKGHYLVSKTFVLILGLFTYLLFSVCAL